MADRLFRRVIRIAAMHSPNVRYAENEIAAGKEPSGRVLLEGVLTWDEYCMRRATWDKVRACIGLDARFWEGPNVLLYPPVWLDKAHDIHRSLFQRKRQAKAIGIDPAEGGDQTSMCAVDELGMIDLVSKKTPDTSDVTDLAEAFMKKHNVPASMVCFDRGGGGKQHADRLRRMGHVGIRTVAFGETLVLDPKRSKRTFGERKDIKESKYSYFNRRAQMYHRLRELLDPSFNLAGFGIPDVFHGEEYARLRRELSPMPLLYDGEGRIRMLPKNKRTPDSKEKCLTDLIGHSPDEADALVLAIHAMLDKGHQATAGVA